MAPSPSRPTVSRLVSCLDLASRQHIYILQSSFMNLYASKNLSRESFARHQVSSRDIFDEIPLKVHNSHLVHAFLYELRERGDIA
jgi:hypothetical protein